MTGQVLYEHLIGAREDASDVIGLYPMFPDETVNFLVFDFDCHEDKIGGDDGANPDPEWMTEVNAFRKICENNDVPVLVERSRSGKGAHTWMFFERPIPAITARRFGTALLTKGAESVNMKNFEYYDRMLPAQDHLPINSKTGLGNLVALPLQGQALKYGNSAFIDENWNAYPNQWGCLKDVKKLSFEIVEERIKEWSAEGILGVLSNEFEGDVETTTATKPWDKAKHPLHKEDVTSTVEIVIADRVYINSKNMKPRMQNALRRMAAFSNPDFYKKAAMGKTAKSILVSCGARLASFDIDQVREITMYDELELDTLGDRKTALFLVMSDTDPTFNFLISMIYSQLFNLLCDKAYNVYKGRLPVHVRCLIDETANIGQIPNLEKLVATIRSREISACLFLQAKSQLKAIYKDNADTIIGNMVRPEAAGAI